MNIFYLDKDPVKAAQAMCDKHVVKMVLESAQMLCSIHEDAPYRRTHYSHPSTKWSRTTRENYNWLLAHAYALCDEYTHRYGKTHKSQQVIDWCAQNIDKVKFNKSGFTQPPQAMPKIYHSPDSVYSYRKYYLMEKNSIASWKKNRNPPNWW